jgi:hypothetical protein
LRPEAVVVAAEVAAVVAVVVAVSRAAVRRPAAAFPRGRQPVSQHARRRGRKPGGNNLAPLTEIVATGMQHVKIASSTGTRRVKTASNNETRHVKTVRTSLRTSGMTTIVIMEAQPW